jgi:hypothetical protein
LILDVRFAFQEMTSMHDASHTPARRTSQLRALIFLNAALLIVLGAVTFGSMAKAQARGRGEYTMVSGGVPGADSAAVYIVDVNNQEMVIMTYSPQNKTLEGVGYRNLAVDAANASRNQRPRN